MNRELKQLLNLQVTTIPLSFGREKMRLLYQLLHGASVSSPYGCKLAFLGAALSRS